MVNILDGSKAMTMYVSGPALAENAKRVHLETILADYSCCPGSGVGYSRPMATNSSQSWQTRASPYHDAAQPNSVLATLSVRATRNRYGRYDIERDGLNGAVGLALENFMNVHKKHFDRG
jgi:hypothetical protein